MSCLGEEITKSIQNYTYSTFDIIGQGFSSQVYKGKNTQDNTQVAIKVIDLRKLQKNAMHGLLQSEINIIKILQHTNILKCEKVFITINNCYIVTQLCSHGDLATIIKKKGRLRGMQALKIMVQIARGYSYLAKTNVIHRDIKPANILLNKNTVKIADFGFSMYEANYRKQNYSVGSPLYMSPQALNHNIYSKQGDVWSIGIVFYQILQGRPPWNPKNQKQLREIFKTKPEIIFRIAIRDQLETMIKQCLSYERETRISPDSILQTLQSIMQQMSENDKQSAYRQTLTRRPSYTAIPKTLSEASIHRDLSMKNIVHTEPLGAKIINSRDTNLPSTNLCLINKLIAEKLNKKPCLAPLKAQKKPQQQIYSRENILLLNEKRTDLKQKQQQRMASIKTLASTSNSVVAPVTEQINTAPIVTEPTTHILPNISSTPMPLAMSIEDASRFNHKILKSLINFARFLYKLFAKISNIRTIQPWLLQRIQIEMVGMLLFTINILSSGLKKQNNQLTQAHKILGVLMFNRFIQTRCYSKTVMVVEQYLVRYTKFLKKKQQQIITPQNALKIPKYTCFSDFKNSIQRIKEVVKLLKPISQSKSSSASVCNQHNSTINYLVQLLVLLDILQKQDIANFSDISCIQDIVDAQPHDIIEQQHIQQLCIKMQQVINK